MKKLIAILAVFAVVAGAALFAQDGSWSVGGGAMLGTMLNFSPYQLRDSDDPETAQSVATIAGWSYNQHDWWGDFSGSLSATYRKGGLSTGLSFNQLGKIGANVNYDADGFRFQGEQDLIDLFNGDFNPGRLWGWYKMLDGIIHLEAAADSRDTQFWNTASGIIDDSYTKVDHHDYLLLNATPIQGLELGFMLPGVFAQGNSDSNRAPKGVRDNVGFGNANTWAAAVEKSTLSSGIYPAGPAGELSEVSVYPSQAFLRNAPFQHYRELVKQSLEFTTFGLKYGTGPFEASVQYGLRGRPIVYDADGNIVPDITFLDSVAYAGAQFRINDAMTAAAVLHAGFFKTDNNSDNVDLRFAGRFSYNTGPLNSRLDIIYFNDINSKIENGFVRFRPLVGYMIVPGTLKFQLDARVDLPLGEWALGRNVTTPVVRGSDAYEEGYFKRPVADVRNAEEEDLIRRAARAWDLRYRVIPELFFSLSGSGAGDQWAIGNGIMVRYWLEGNVYGSDAVLNRFENRPTRNSLDINFRWSF